MRKDLGALEIDHVKPSDSGLGEAFRDVRRIRVVDRRPVVVALGESYSLAAEQIDRGDQLEGDLALARAHRLASSQAR